MTTEYDYRIAFIVLLVMLLAMRVFFMLRVRRSGGQIMPNRQAVEREGGKGVLVIRMLSFFALMTFLVMYVIGISWINRLLFVLPGWMRWCGFFLGLVSITFWTWTQITLDTQWSAQLQLTKNHHLITTGPYAYLRHPLYASVLVWCIALSLLTANWIFVAFSVLSIAGLLYRIPKEEQMMLDAFGNEYKIYVQHTGRFFPKLLKGNKNEHS